MESDTVRSLLSLASSDEPSSPQQQSLGHSSSSGVGKLPAFMSRGISDVLSQAAAHGTSFQYHFSPLGKVVDIFRLPSTSLPPCESSSAGSAQSSSQGLAASSADEDALPNRPMSARMAYSMWEIHQIRTNNSSPNLIASHAAPEGGEPDFELAPQHSSNSTATSSYSNDSDYQPEDAEEEVEN